MVFVADEQSEPAERGKHDQPRRRAALIEAATTIFAEHGYDAATTRAVAERSGCAEGLIHRYFGGKQGLLIAILEEQAENLEESFRTGVPDRDSVAEEIDQMLRWALDMMWEKQCFMRVSVSRAAIDPEIGRTITARLHRERARLIAAKLRRHQQAGRIPAAVDVEDIAEMIVGVAFAYGFADQVMAGVDRERVRHVAEATAGLITRGVTAPASTAETAPNSQGAAQA
jgi:AcrR family transcriptional regulator